MEIALGVLGWTPAVFWAATPPEFRVAFKGWRQVNCLPGPEPQGVSRDDFEALKRRFPDRSRRRGEKVCNR